MVTGDVQQLVRAIASGADPARVADRALRAALAACGARDGMVVASAGGRVEVLASAGTPSSALDAAARASSASGRPAWRTEEGSGHAVFGAPLRTGASTVGAIALAGGIGRIDPAVVSLFADTIALALGARPRTSARVVDVLEAVVVAGRESDADAVVARAVDTAVALFGANAACALVARDGHLRLGAARHLTTARLGVAFDAPELRELLSSSTVRVEHARSAVARLLTDGDDALVVIPLGRGRGHLLLLVATAPDPSLLSELAAFGRAIGAALVGPELRSQARVADAIVGALTTSSPNPVLVTSTDGSVLHANARGARLVDQMPHDAHSHVVAAVDADGVEHAYRVRRVTVTDPDGADVHVAAFDDVTARGEIERIKADLVAVIGHELRTPLTVLRSGLRTLSKRGTAITEDALISTLDAMARNVARLERLIEDLLFVAAATEGHNVIDVTPTDLAALVDAVAGGRVRVRRPSSPLVVGVDAALVRRALDHLVDNACKHSEGDVEVEVVVRDGEVEIAVVDHGAGIFSGDLPTLFSRFRQIDGSSTRATGGTGLGLFVTRRIVEAHGGRIWCSSRLGQGTRFAFTLPST
ncbi:MAG: two-component system, OmpR family, phosphate regulon sensor histidine kinase PhoR [Actinomycetota bacterium]|nr:two-component system, OmpR family, phosphate regulon sensor histidine kinase PhoR [Actinomycetota bacterium]